MVRNCNVQNRDARRSPVLLTASIEVAGVPKPVRLRNISDSGTLVEGDCLPPEGSITFFERNELRLSSRVVWVQGRYAGVAFERPLKREEVLRQVPIPKPRELPDTRRPGLACRPLTSYERSMLETWLSNSYPVLGD